MRYSGEKLSAIYDKTNGYCHLCHRKLSYSNYGGVPVKAEYCHEAVSILRRVTWIILKLFVEGPASITPFFVDIGFKIREIHWADAFSFYRLLYSGFRAREFCSNWGKKSHIVSQTSSLGIEADLLHINIDRKNSTFFICVTCQSHYEQPLGKMISRVHEASGQTNLIFKSQPTTLGSDRCPECNSHLHVRTSHRCWLLTSRLNSGF